MNHQDPVSYLMHSLSIREQHLGQQHPDTAQTLHDLALFYQKQGKVSEALSLAERALQIRLQSLGDAHPKTAASRALVAQFVEIRGANQDGTSCPHGAKEHPDHLSTARLRKETVLTSQETSDYSPSENDPLQEFLAACCDLHPRAWCRSSDLWEAYQNWVEASQERYPLSRGAFTTQLKKHGCCADRTKTTRIWRGIALVNKNDDAG